MVFIFHILQCRDRPLSQAGWPEAGTRGPMACAVDSDSGFEVVRAAFQLPRGEPPAGLGETPTIIALLSSRTYRLFGAGATEHLGGQGNRYECKTHLVAVPTKSRSIHASTMPGARRKVWSASRWKVYLKKYSSSSSARRFPL